VLYARCPGGLLLFPWRRRGGGRSVQAGVTCWQTERGAAEGGEGDGSHEAERGRQLSEDA
jgi:hypothetical protein